MQPDQPLVALDFKGEIEAIQDDDTNMGVGLSEVFIDCKTYPSENEGLT